MFLSAPPLHKCPSPPHAAPAIYFLTTGFVFRPCTLLSPPITMGQIDALLYKLDEKLQEDKFRTAAYAGAVAFSLLAFYSSQRLRAYIRTFLLLCTIAVNSSWGILISFWVGIETNYYATKHFADVCEWSIGLKLVVIEGREYLDNPGPSVVIYNHQSMLDMIFLGRGYWLSCDFLFPALTFRYNRFYAP